MKIKEALQVGWIVISLLGVMFSLSFLIVGMIRLVAGDKLGFAYYGVLALVLRETFRAERKVV